MIFSVLGDIKGNINALEAAVDALDAEGVDLILHAGNCAVGYSEVNAVIDLIRARHIQAVQGELDRHLVRMRTNSTLRSTRLSLEDQEAIIRAREFISSTNLEFLRSLSRRKRFTLEGIEVLLCFGSPSNPFMPLSSHTPLIRFDREREYAQADIVVFGGARKPFYKWVNQTLFVGIAPMFTEQFPSNADYVLINTETKPWTVRLKRSEVTSPL